MHHSDRLLLWSYKQLLWLYPRRFREEFGDEMRTVFGQAMAEARKQSRITLAHLVWRELCDMPGALICAHIQERRKRRMERPPAAIHKDMPSTWSETLVGTLPFLLWGPLMTLLSYPYPSPEVRYLLYLLPALVGAIAGWLKGFPRWCYPYWGLSLMLLGVAGMTEISHILFSRGVQWSASIPGQICATVGITAVLVGSILLLSRLLPFLGELYRGIRQDWTQLSFGFYSFAALMFGGIDLDEDPTLTFFVLTPSLMVVLGALAYLRSTTKAQRALALMLGVLLAMTVRIVGGKWFYLLYGIINTLIVLIPALLEFLPRPAKTTAA